MPALHPAQWADALRGAIAQIVGGMREIQRMSQQAEWDAYFKGWLADSSIPKDTRKTLKHLLPAVISMAEDMNDLVLADLGISASGLPAAAAFAANSDIEPRDLRIAQIDMQESAGETAHSVLAVSKPGRTLVADVYDTSGTPLIAGQVMTEIVAGVFHTAINWKQAGAIAGYYIIRINDADRMDAAMVEISSAMLSTLARMGGKISFG